MQLIIIGASGHGKVVADIARLNGYTDIVFLDDDRSKKTCGQYPVLGNAEKIQSMEGDVFIAVGNAANRKALLEQCEDRHFPVLIHPTAVIARDVEIGDGTAVMAGAVINSSARLGRGVIVNTCSSIDHDCVIEDYVHVAVGAHICGTVTVGEGTWIGAGSTISNNISICSNCIIGAGAVVVSSINKAGTYLGIPAKIKT